MQSGVQLRVYYTDPAARAGERLLAGLNALGRLLAVGSEWAGYATLVPTGGARKAARAAADEASEQLGRQGARQASRPYPKSLVLLQPQLVPNRVDFRLHFGRHANHIGPFAREALFLPLGGGVEADFAAVADIRAGVIQHIDGTLDDQRVAFGVNIRAPAP
jgi:hypothetical protein